MSVRIASVLLLTSTLAGAGALAGLAPADAAPPPPPGPAPAAPTPSLPAPDPASIVTIQVENDAVSTLKGTSDQYYTSGIRLGWTSPTGMVPGFLQGLGNSLFGYGQQRVGIDVSQSIFTPRNTQLNPPDSHDRPYAGWLHADLSFLQDTQGARNLIGLSLGVVGPSALGEDVQNGFHSLIGDPSNKGWGYQLKDEPAFEIYGQRTWRVPIAQFGSGVGIGALETDALPSVTIGVGNVRDYVQAGLRLRIGQGLASDFGPARIMPGINGSDAFTPVRPFAWYLFVGGDGQGIARDLFLDGNTFRSRPGPHVSKYPYLGEFEAGVGVMLYGVRLTYTQTWQTESFHGQKGGLFSFGSLAASVRF